MIKSPEELMTLASYLTPLFPLSGTLEGKYLLSEGKPPSRELVAEVQEDARSRGFEPEDESHEIEGRHMLTLTWHF